MTELELAELKIQQGNIKAGLKILKSLKGTSIKKEYLTALAYFKQNTTDSLNLSREILLGIILQAGRLKEADNKSRTEIMSLLGNVSKVTDAETFRLLSLNTDEILALGGDPDIIKSVYLGGSAIDNSMAEVVNRKKELFSERLKNIRTIFPNKYFIQFYKNFSSFTPLLKPLGKNSLGGGYFLNLSDYGFVIDPGHNFLENFYSAGRSFDDIDGIAVTHFHDDHYADLPSLLGLIFQCGKSERYADKKYGLFLDLETFEKFKGFFEGLKNYETPVILRSTDKKEIKLKEGVILKPLKTIHPTIIPNSGVGILLNIEQIKTQLFITGDTGWSEEIAVCYKAELLEGWKKIMVAHISSLYNPEAERYLLYGEENFNKKHLCLLGVLKAVECVNPRALILSEIGEELESVVGYIAKLIEKKYNIKCLIGMKNLRYNLRN
jgi:hypothetical protein